MDGQLQLSIEGADRLHHELRGRRAPVSAGEAAGVLFALRSAPAPLARQLVAEVVADDARFVWRSGGELALSEWEETAPTGQPLEQARFVVFDLETTGTRAGSSRILELGAVRVEMLTIAASMERLVDPRIPIPAEITAITGLTDNDVRGAPRIDRVLGEFLRFAAGSVLVAHNARFDVGFVDAELSRLAGARTAAPVICTVALARRLMGGRLSRYNLGTLAERFDTGVRPCHRALPDALATAEVLLMLIGMAQEQGAETVEDVLGLCAPAPRRLRPRRKLAAGVPTGPGVYVFRDEADVPLYVGKAADLRSRVRSYFGAGRLPAPVERALEQTGRIEARPLGSLLEAALVELELIARLRPVGNRRDAKPDRCHFVVLIGGGPVPRLRVTTRPPAGDDRGFGPLGSRSQAQALADAATETYRLRTCRPDLPEDDGSCLAGAVGSCLAPCRGGAAAAAYAEAVEHAATWLAGAGPDAAGERLASRMAEFAAERRYEDAARVRDRMATVARARGRIARLERARRCSGVLLAADLDDRFVHAFACVRGVVVARRRVARGGDGRLELESLAAALAEGFAGPERPLTAVEAAQARIVAAGFARPGSALAAVPVAGADGLGRVVERVAAARRAVPLRS
jgi:DNA polymerase-3 subunit epsilon